MVILKDRHLAFLLLPMIKVSGRSILRNLEIFSLHGVHWTSSSDVGQFFLLGVHVRPENAFCEINNLHMAFLAASDHYGTQRGIILGVFQAGCSYLSAKKYRQLSLVTNTSFAWLLDQNTYTNVKMSCPYDRWWGPVFGSDVIVIKVCCLQDRGPPLDSASGGR